MADKMFQKVSVVITLTAFLLTGCSQSDSQVLEALPSLLSNSSVKLSECTAETENGYYNLDMVFEGKANITYIDYASKRKYSCVNNPVVYIGQIPVGLVSLWMKVWHFRHCLSSMIASCSYRQALVQQSLLI